MVILTSLVRLFDEIQRGSLMSEVGITITLFVVLFGLAIVCLAES